MRIEESPSNIVALSDIRDERRRALSPYGPVKAGLTTLPTTNEVRLTELLNSLESVVDNLNFKSFTVYDMFNTALEEARAALSGFTQDTDGTDAELD